MKLEQQVVSIDLAKKLKSLHVKQESYFEWLYYPSDMEWKVSPTFNNQLGYSAFTASELGEMLPFIIEYNDKKYWYHTGKVNKDNKYYKEHEVNYTNNQSMIFLFRGNTEANVRAETLIYLLKNKLIIMDN